MIDIKNTAVNVDINNSNDITSTIKFFMPNAEDKYIVICCGSTKGAIDRIMPTIGSKIEELYPNITVYGTLDNPIHRANFEEKIVDILDSNKDKKIITVIGLTGLSNTIPLEVVSIHQGASIIGKGINDPKNPPIGDISIRVFGGKDIHDYFTLVPDKETIEEISNNVAKGIANALVI